MRSNAGCAVIDNEGSKKNRTACADAAKSGSLKAEQRKLPGDC
jgi:hypothetical protein